MNGFNRHNRYRKRTHKRKNISIVLIISIILIVLFVVAFFVVGNILLDQSKKRDEEKNKQPESTETENNGIDQKTYPIIQGYSVLLETTDSTIFSGRLNSIIEKGYSSASIPLNSKDGTLLFKSDIADGLGYFSSSQKTLKSAVETAKSKGVYLSGVYYISAFSEPNKLLRSVELSRSASIVAEVLTAGFNEVVIIAPEVSAEHTQEIIKFVNDIRSLTDSGKVGITVSDSILESENVSETINLLNEKIDFFCLDVSEHGDSDPNEYIEEQIGKNNFYLLMYKMRLLLPYSDSKTSLDAYISITEKYDLSNWQII